MFIKDRFPLNPGSTKYRFCCISFSGNEQLTVMHHTVASGYTAVTPQHRQTTQSSLGRRVRLFPLTDKPLIQVTDPSTTKSCFRTIKS
jgi:hypothetical protein